MRGPGAMPDVLSAEPGKVRTMKISVGAIAAIMSLAVAAVAPAQAAGVGPHFGNAGGAPGIGGGHVGGGGVGPHFGNAGGGIGGGHFVNGGGGVGPHFGGGGVGPHFGGGGPHFGGGRGPGLDGLVAAGVIGIAIGAAAAA